MCVCVYLHMLSFIHFYKQWLEAQPCFVIRTQNTSGKVFLNVCLHPSIPVNEIVCIGSSFRQIVGKSEGAVFDIVVNESAIGVQEKVL